MLRTITIAALALAACTEADSPVAGIAGPIALNATGYETAASFLSCMEGKGAVVSAHRGGPAPGFPENAVETFENTLSRIPALIETDVRETRDGVLVLLHDETVDRTTNGSGSIASMTLAEAKALRLVDANGRETDFQIPTLDEALNAMRGRTILQLDVKRGVGLRKVAEAVDRAGAEPFTVMITYNDRGAEIAAGADPEASVVASIDGMADVADLLDAGVPQERLIVWTGLLDEPRPALFAELGERDISTSGGAIGQLDDRAEAGERGVYRDLAEAGLDIIATDRPFEAAREIGVEATAAAAARCAR